MENVIQPPIDQGAAGNPPVNQSGEGQGNVAGGGAALEPKTFETPDGRKLTAEELEKEWKENFLPDYTKKSQELAALKKPLDSDPQPKDKWRDPSYQPQTWDEILAEAETRAERRIFSRLDADKEVQRKVEEERTTIAKQIDDEVVKIKETDKTLDENDMFTFSAEKAKKGVQYSSVNALYEDYKMVREARIKGQQDAMRYMTRREGQNVGVGGGVPAGNQPINLQDIRKHASIVDAVADRLRNLNK